MKLLDYHTFSLSNSYDQWVWSFVSANWFAVVVLGLPLGIFWTGLLFLGLMLRAKISFLYVRMVITLLMIVILLLHFDLTLLILFVLLEGGRAVLYSLPDLILSGWSQIAKAQETKTILGYFHHLQQSRPQSLQAWLQLLWGYYNLTLTPPPLTMQQLRKLEDWLKQAKGYSFSLEKQFVLKVDESIFFWKGGSIVELPYQVDNRNFTCPLCQKPKQQLYIRECHHNICLDCVVQWGDCLACRLRDSKLD
ncbi:MAG: RING finger protein [Nitrososphaerales archaeon]